MESIRTLFILFISILIIGCVNAQSRDSRKGGLRGLTSTSELKCLVMVVDTYSESHGYSHSFACRPVINGSPISMAYTMDLPAYAVDEHGEELMEGDREIIIEGGWINDEEIVVIPSGSLIHLIRDSRVETPPSEYVTRTALVVRVSTTDSNATLSAPQLSEKIFGSGISMKSQYSACSHGKLTFVEADILGAQDGVLSIDLGISVVNKTRQHLTNAAITYIETQLGSNLEDVVDNVLFCHPPGSMGDWVAYAFLNNHISVYNDLWCGYLSSTMHEVGHNIGFLHSNQAGLYQDQTGYMGFSYPQVDTPSMCFNGKKNFQIGWFADRAITVDPSIAIWKGKIATFVDYDLTNPSQNVVVRVGDLYLQYNRAKGMNSETREMQNQLTIVEDKQGGSELLAGLDGLYFNTTLFRRENYGANNETLFVIVCNTYLGDSVSTADYMFVSIGLDAIDCSEAPTGAPSESPEPSPSPSGSPISSPSESPAPSPSPSRTPSLFPTQTHAPTPLQPTNEPSWVEPDRGQICDDDMESEFDAGDDLGLKKCSWLQDNPSMIPFLCVNGMEAYDTCAETCGKCSDSCEDSFFAFFQYNGTVASCNTIRDETDPVVREDMCTLAKDWCRETCNTCASDIDNPTDCDDSQAVTFFVPGVGDRRCAWLARNTSVPFRDVLCTPDSPVFHLCAETCGKCFDDCEDNATATFVHNGATRTCGWLAIKPLIYNAVCNNNVDARNGCKETCNTCESRRQRYLS